jgi:hypothetical protein
MKTIHCLSLVIALLVCAAPAFPWGQVAHTVTITVAFALTAPGNPTLNQYLADVSHQQALEEMVHWPDDSAYGESGWGHGTHLEKLPTDAQGVPQIKFHLGESRSSDNLPSRLLRWLDPLTTLLVQVSVPGRDVQLAFLAHYSGDICTPPHLLANPGNLTEDEQKNFHTAYETRFVKHEVERCGGEQPFENLVWQRACVQAETYGAGFGKADAEEQIRGDALETYRRGWRLNDKTGYQVPARGDWSGWEQQEVDAQLVDDLARTALTIRKYWTMAWSAN